MSHSTSACHCSLDSSISGYWIPHQTWSVNHPASYSVGIEPFSFAVKRMDVKLTTHHHLVMRLRMSGAITLLPPYAFVTWWGTIWLLLKLTSFSKNHYNIVFPSILAEKNEILSCTRHEIISGGGGIPPLMLNSVTKNSLWCACG